jgi:hypothetical protein
MSDTTSKREAVELIPDMIELMTFGPGGSITAWSGPDLPEPFDLNEPERPENACSAGADCAAATATGGYPVGYHLAEVSDQWDSGREEVQWFACWVVDGRWILCEDCAACEDDGELTITDEGEFIWSDTDPNIDAVLTARDLGLPTGPVDR